MKTHSLEDIANQINGSLHGDPKAEIFGISSLIEAISGQITFLENKKYAKYLEGTKASCVLLSKEYVEICPVASIEVDNPYIAYAKLSHLFNNAPDRPHSEIHKSAIIHSDTTIHPSVAIGPYSVIEKGVVLEKGVDIGAGVSIGADSHIGADSRIFDNVTIYHNVSIHKRVNIHSGVVIGSDGFGNARTEKGWLKILQLGGVVIKDDVEIGANTTIDRGALGDTIIGVNVKLDNQIQVGHNVEIGDFSAIAGCTGIAGSTKIGKRCLIGGHVGFNGHITIADDVMITGKSGVSKSIKKPGIYSSGLPAEESSTWRKTISHVRRLPKYVDKLKEIVKKADDLEQLMKKGK